MKRKEFILTLVAAIALASGGFLVASAVAQRRSPMGSNYQVQLQATKATPDTLSIPVGSTVQFDSHDGNEHELALGEGAADGHGHDHTGAYSSGTFGADEGWRVQFKETGTYFFHDHKNPDINILVVVYGKS